LTVDGIETEKEKKMFYVKHKSLPVDGEEKEVEPSGVLLSRHDIAE
jgi:hypothetical protein